MIDSRTSWPPVAQGNTRPRREFSTCGTASGVATEGQPAGAQRSESEFTCTGASEVEQDSTSDSPGGATVAAATGPRPLRQQPFDLGPGQERRRGQQSGRRLRLEVRGEHRGGGHAEPAVREVLEDLREAQRRLGDLDAPVRLVLDMCSRPMQ